MPRVLFRRADKRLLIVAFVFLIVEWRNGVILPMLSQRANLATIEVIQVEVTANDRAMLETTKESPSNEARRNLESYEQNNVVLPVQPAQYDEKGGTKPTMVLIHSYQRTGSTFMGEMFNWNPEVFYWFEPVDAVYSHMYGTAFGFNAPSDIVSHPNGSVRILPKHEIQTVAKTLVKILHCDFHDLSPGVLVHRFMKTFRNQQRALDSYLTCLGKIIHADCSAQLRVVCPKRFRENPAAEQKCHQQLQNLDNLECPNNCLKGRNITAGTCAFCRYKACQSQKFEHSQKCLNHLITPCRKASIRAIKTVRLTMNVVEEMLVQEPALKVVHHYRDPRAVVLSRNYNPTFHGQAEEYNMTHEAGIYCTNLENDVIKGSELKRKYRGAILDSLFESSAERPVLSALQMYSFVGQVVPEEVKDWLHNNTRRGKGGPTSRDSKAMITRWMNRIRPRLRMGIDSVCTKLYELLDFPWPMLTDKDKKAKEPKKDKKKQKDNVKDKKKGNKENIDKKDDTEKKVKKKKVPTATLR